MLTHVYIHNENDETEETHTQTTKHTVEGEDEVDLTLDFAGYNNLLLGVCSLF